MKTRITISRGIFCLFASIAITACGGSPTGYDWILKHHGGAHVDTISAGPEVLANYAAGWAREWQTPLAFFSAEIDSVEASHAKAGLLSLSILASAIEFDGQGQVAPEAKAQFAKQFPISKVRDLLAKHPEYAEWAVPLKRTKFASELKLK